MFGKRRSSLRRIVAVKVRALHEIRKANPSEHNDEHKTERSHQSAMRIRSTTMVPVKFCLQPNLPDAARNEHARKTTARNSDEILSCRALPARSQRSKRPSRRLRQCDRAGLKLPHSAASWSRHHSTPTGCRLSPRRRSVRCTFSPPQTGNEGHGHALPGTKVQC